MGGGAQRPRAYKSECLWDFIPSQRVPVLGKPAILSLIHIILTFVTMSLFSVHVSRCRGCCHTVPVLAEHKVRYIKSTTVFVP
jgi:hypothetical protein